MTPSEIPRATDPSAISSSIFKIGADPDQWVEQHAGPYRERPSAVIRELIQNAHDSVQKSSSDLMFAELAILDQEQARQPR